MYIESARIHRVVDKFQMVTMMVVTVMTVTPTMPLIL